MKGCPFCPMFKDIDPGILTIVIQPLNPVTPGHLLVIPREHVSDMSDSPDITAMVMRRAAEVCKQYRNVNIITSKGEHATQTVGHLHVHIVPRREGDGLTLPWTGQKK